MPIIKWEPFEEIDKIFEGFNLPASAGFTPAVDVYEEKNEVVVETPLAGIDPKEVEITIEDDILHIKGETKKESEVEEKNYYRKEIRSGSFHRSVALPTHVLGDKAKAESEDGMLKIVIPKSKVEKPKSIKVKISESKKK